MAPLAEKKTILKVPSAYLPLIEDIRLLKTDEQNPNKMTAKQQDQVWHSLKKYGWTYPIIINNEGFFADGEQRTHICIPQGEFFVPVLRLSVSEVDRRMLRQILNKLKGKHSHDLEVEEFTSLSKLERRMIYKSCFRLLARSCLKTWAGQRKAQT